MFLHRQLLRFALPRYSLTVAKSARPRTFQPATRFQHYQTIVTDPSSVCSDHSERAGISSRAVGGGLGGKFANGSQLLEASGREKVGIDDARELLKRSYLALKDLPVEERNAAVADVGAASVLEWAQSLTAEAWSNIGETRVKRLMELLCWHLEAERLASSADTPSTIEQWLDSLALESNSQLDLLKKYLLYGHVRSTGHLNSIDAAIESAYKYRVQYSTLNSKATVMLQLLIIQRAPSEENFNRYLAMVDSERRKGIILLYHPINPSADDFLRIQSPSADLGPPAAFVSGMRKRHALRASYILRLQGRANEAKTLDHMYQIIRGQRRYDRLVSCREDARLSKLHARSAHAEAVWREILERKENDTRPERFSETSG